MTAIHELMERQDKDNYLLISVWGALGLPIAIALAAFHLPFWPAIAWMILGWVLCVARTMRKHRRIKSVTLTYRI